jgi:hypothetical protein
MIRIGVGDSVDLAVHAIGLIGRSGAVGRFAIVYERLATGRLGAARCVDFHRSSQGPTGSGNSSSDILTLTRVVTDTPLF